MVIAPKVNNYEFMDMNAPAAINYYRIRQVDFDGTSSTT
jgi:hypothetical protein